MNYFHPAWFELEPNDGDHIAMKDAVLQVTNHFGFTDWASVRALDIRKLALEVLAANYPTWRDERVEQWSAKNLVLREL